MDLKGQMTVLKKLNYLSIKVDELSLITPGGQFISYGPSKISAVD